jgi:redox-sensing transcriptional repressor
MMNENSAQPGIATLRRLPVYLQVLRGIADAGDKNISSALLAKQLEYDPIQVRKDLAATGVVGRPRLGFDIKELVAAIENCLGWNNRSDAFLVGVGSLGSALLGYQGFEQFGLRIVAAFDANPKLIGSKVHGCTVLDTSTLAGLVKRMRVNIGILTVSPESAQDVCNEMLKGGIQGIWNFTPTRLHTPNDVVIQRVDLAADLAILSHRLAHGGPAS